MSVEVGADVLAEAVWVAAIMDVRARGAEVAVLTACRRQLVNRGRVACILE